MKIEIDAPDFDGFECTGEFRSAREGEFYWNDFAQEVAECYKDGNDIRFIIYRKVEPPEPEYRVFRKIKNSESGTHHIDSMDGESLWVMDEVTDTVTVIPKGQEGPTPQKAHALLSGYGIHTEMVEQLVDALFPKDEPSDPLDAPDPFTMEEQDDADFESWFNNR